MGVEMHWASRRKGLDGRAFGIVFMGKEFYTSS